MRPALLNALPLGCAHSPTPFQGSLRFPHSALFSPSHYVYSFPTVPLRLILETDVAAFPTSPSCQKMIVIFHTSYNLFSMGNC